MQTLCILKAYDMNTIKAVLEFYTKKGVRVSILHPLLLHYEDGKLPEIQDKATQPSVMNMFNALRKKDLWNAPVTYWPELKSVMRPLFNISDKDNDGVVRV